MIDQDDDTDNEPPVYVTPIFGRVSAVVHEIPLPHESAYITTLREHFVSAGEARTRSAISTTELGNAQFAMNDAARWIADKRVRTDRERNF